MKHLALFLTPSLFFLSLLFSPMTVVADEECGDCICKPMSGGTVVSKDCELVPAGSCQSPIKAGKCYWAEKIDDKWQFVGTTDCEAVGDSCQCNTPPEGHPDAVSHSNTCTDLPIADPFCKGECTYSIDGGTESYPWCEYTDVGVANPS